ncbi:MAG: hypothetical protein LBU18_05290 [Treponema sp.]|jgi:hypothetical protein|nr:hypothetical protein [Treponema sp.]
MERFMAIISNANKVLHRVRVKLHPNYLPNTEGTYIARTGSEASLSIEYVCTALKNRGGFPGNYDNLVEYINEFFNEAQCTVSWTAFLSAPVIFRFTLAWAVLSSP